MSTTSQSKSAYSKLINGYQNEKSFNSKDNDSLTYTDEELMNPSIKSLKDCDDMLNEARRKTQETISVGADTLVLLEDQGKQIINMNGRVHGIAEKTSVADRFLNKMLCNAKKHTVVIVLSIIILLAIVVMLLISKLH